MARKSTKSKTTKETPTQSSTYLEKLENEIQGNQSRLSLVLGALIVLVLGFLIFNYFNKNKADLGPAQTTELTEQGDVSKENLPGKYTIKEGDTLFAVAEEYYNDGFKYTEIAKVNNINDVNTITAGQVIEIPKLEGETTVATSPTPTATPESTPTPLASPAIENQGTSEVTKTDFGPAIKGNSYTVIEGDWLSTIAARAYGDVLAYTKLAQANNIVNPDYITPGMVLTIPR